MNHAPKPSLLRFFAIASMSGLCWMWCFALQAGAPAKDPLRSVRFRLNEPVEEQPELVARLAYASPGEADEEQGASGGKTWYLSLREFLEKTLENNLDLRIQRYTPTLSELGIEQNVSAFDPFFEQSFRESSYASPQADALGGGDVITSKSTSWNFALSKKGLWGWSGRVNFDNTRSTTDSTFSTFNPSYRSNVLFSFQQPLLKNFGRDINERQITVSQNNFAISEEEFRRQVIEKVLEAERAYWNLIYSIDNLEVQEQALLLAKDLHDINKTRVEVGTMAPLDIAQAEAGVAAREEGVIVARSSVEDGEDNLRRLLNLPLDSPLWEARIRPTDHPEFDDRTPDLEQALAKSLENRIEIKKAMLEMMNKEIDLRYARNQKLPDLLVSATYGLSGLGGKTLVRDFGGPIIDTIPGGYTDALNQIVDRDFSNWSIGVNLSYPIFNRAAKTGIENAVLSRSLQADLIDNLKLSITQEVRQTVRQVDTARQRVHAARVSVRLQEKKLDAEQKKYQHGLSTSFNVLEFQNDLTSARSSLIRAITDYTSAWLSLDRAMGTLLETKNIDIDRVVAPGLKPESAPADESE